MDTRKLIVVKTIEHGIESADITTADGTAIAYDINTEDAAELVKRWNAYPELVAALRSLSEALATALRIQGKYK